MAIIQSYPTITPTTSDLVLIVDTSEDGNPTKTATVSSIQSATAATSQTLVPFLITASSGGSSTFSDAKDMIYIDWTGGAGTYNLTLPSAATLQYRLIRISNNGNVGANNKIDVYAPGSETIDGASYYRINKPYNGIQCWSDGTNWVVIQAKST